MFARTPTALGPPKKKNYQTKATNAAIEQIVMPDMATVAMGELAETAKEGLLALAVGAGLQVMEVMMAESVTWLVRSEGCPRRGPLGRTPWAGGRIGDPRRPGGAGPTAPGARRRRRP